MRRIVVLAGLLSLVAGCENKLAIGTDPTATTATTKPTEHEIEFVGAGGVKLKGSLMLPPGTLDQRRPCVLIIAGSGPTDRDGNQPGLKLDTLKQLAYGLAQAEIASFRFDKRAVATNAAQWPTDPKEYGPYFSWNNHIDDALAAWGAMRKSDFVDKSRCAILGHSEGGTIALAMSDRAKPLALVLVSTPARPYDVVIRSQLEHQLKGAGALGQKLLAENDRISKQIKAIGKVPSDVPKELAALYNPSVGVFFQQSFSTVPAEIAHGFPGPILVINGDSDQQVDPKLDGKALFDACNKTLGSQFVLVPLASHNLKPVKNASEPGLLGDIVPDAIESLQEFLVPKIGGKVPEGQGDVR